MSRLKAKKPSEVSPGHAKGVLFGGPGGGKTWHALSFPKPFYIDTEGGARRGQYQERLSAAGGAYFGPDEGSTDHEEVLGQVRALATESHPYATLVLDSASKTQGSMIGEAQEKLGDNDAFGASKKPMIAWSRKMLTWISRLNMNVWLICHEVAEWSGEGNNRREIGKKPDVWEKWLYELDLALHVRKVSKGNRVAVVYKSRLQGFPDFDQFYLQKGGDDIGYAEFARRYGKDFIEQSSIPVVLATPEQMARIAALERVITPPQDVRDKWFRKAGVDSYEDLKQNEAAGIIGWFEGKLKEAQS